MTGSDAGSRAGRTDGADDDGGVATPPAADAEALAAAKRGLARDMALYTAFRLALVVVLAAALYGIGRLVTDQMPIIVALLFAIIIALPVSMVLARGLRRRITGHAAVLDADRRQRRAAFRQRLQGRAD